MNENENLEQEAASLALEKHNISIHMESSELRLKYIGERLKQIGLIQQGISSTKKIYEPIVSKLEKELSEHETQDKEVS